MHMWKNALNHVWNTRPIGETQKPIDRMPKIMEAIIEAKGGRQNIEFDKNLRKVSVVWGC